MKAVLQGSRAVCLSLALAALSPAGSAEEPPAETWRSFAGTWSASGRRDVVAIEGGRKAAIVEVSGAVVLTMGEGLSRGFLGEAIGFDDGQGLSAGRCVWTDESGDRLFSRLKGESLRTGKRFVGTISGGTGRYEGLEGEYSFTWQYLVAGEDGGGVIQGRAADLSGRVRRGGASK
jgi:hypothetical protein